MGKSGKPGGWKGRNEKRALARAAARAHVHASGMRRVVDGIDVSPEKHKRPAHKSKQEPRKAATTQQAVNIAKLEPTVQKELVERTCHLCRVRNETDAIQKLATRSIGTDPDASQKPATRSIGTGESLWGDPFLVYGIWDIP